MEPRSAPSCGSRSSSKTRRKCVRLRTRVSAAPGCGRSPWCARHSASRARGGVRAHVEGSGSPSENCAREESAPVSTLPAGSRRVGGRGKRDSLTCVPTVFGVPTVQLGMDGRTHRVGDDGQALCHTPLDYSQPAQQRWISGCTVCDRVVVGLPGPRSARSAGGWLLPAAAGLVVALLLWRLLG